MAAWDADADSLSERDGVTVSLFVTVALTLPDSDPLGLRVATTDPVADAEGVAT